MKNLLLFLTLLSLPSYGQSVRGTILKGIQNDKVSIFINSIWDESEQVSKNNNIPQGLIIAICGLESGWGKSKIAKEQNNIAGIRIGGVYCSYENHLECIEHLGRTLSQSCYKELDLTSLNLWLYALESCYYHNTKDYSKIIRKIYYGNNLNLLDFKK